MQSVTYKLLGFAFVAVAALGVVLPLLPATPFLLLAAGCFARSSETCHRWLMNSRIFGDLLNNWEKNRCVSLNTKIVAYASLIIFGGYSIFFGLEGIIPRLIGVIIVGLGFYYVGRIAICPGK